MSSSLTRTKDVDDVIRQNDDPVGGESHHTRLSKRLSAWDLMGFGIGIVVGTGIFTLTGVQAKDNAGPAIVISFAIAGVVSVLAAICYAELAAAERPPARRTPTPTRPSARSSPGSSPGT